MELKTHTSIPRFSYSPLADGWNDRMQQLVMAWIKSVKDKDRRWRLVSITCGMYILIGIQDLPFLWILQFQR